MNQAVLQFESSGFPPRFFQWLEKNEHVYAAFTDRALKMASTGRARYSAKTIVESLRWETELSDSEIEFKLNNTYTSGMARLFMQAYGDKYPGFFQLRDSLGRDVPGGAFGEQ